MVHVASRGAPGPVAQHASVVASLSGERVIDDQRFAWNVDGTWSIAIEPNGDAWVYTVADFSGWRGELPPSFADGPGFMLPYVSPIALTRDGTFERVADPERVAATIREQLPMASKASSSVAVAAALSSAGVDAVARDHWQIEREAWAELRLERGQQREIPTRAAMPQLGDATLDILALVRRGEDVECPRSRGRRCGTFSMRSAPDPKQVAEILADAAEHGVKAFAMETSVTLVAELETFMPYEYTFERNSKIELEAGAKGGETSRRSYAYTY